MRQVLALSKEYFEYNEMESKEFCSQLTETLFNLRLSSILADDNLVSESGFIDQFKREWASFADSYEKTPSKGPAANQVLATFYLGRFLDCMERFSATLREEFSREILYLKNESRELSAALSIVTTERNVLNNSNAERELKLNEQDKNLRNYASKCAQQEASLTDALEKLRASKKVEEETKDILERADSKMSNLQAKVLDGAERLKAMDELRIQLRIQNDKYEEEIMNLKAEAADFYGREAERLARKKRNKQNCIIS